MMKNKTTKKNFKKRIALKEIFLIALFGISLVVFMFIITPFGGSFGGKGDDFRGDKSKGNALDYVDIFNKANVSENDNFNDKLNEIIKVNEDISEHINYVNDKKRDFEYIDLNSEDYVDAFAKGVTFRQITSVGNSCPSVSGTTCRVKHCLDDGSGHTVSGFSDCSTTLTNYQSCMCYYSSP